MLLFQLTAFWRRSRSTIWGKKAKLAGLKNARAIPVKKIIPYIQASVPVVLNAAEAPTFADTNAVVAWSANLQTQLKTSFKAGALIGRGSGEAVQVAFHGQGFVIVQPSEGITYPVQ